MELLLGVLVVMFCLLHCRAMPDPSGNDCKCGPVDGSEWFSASCNKIRHPGPMCKIQHTSKGCVGSYYSLSFKNSGENNLDNSCWCNNQPCTCKERNGHQEPDDEWECKRLSASAQTTTSTTTTKHKLDDLTSVHTTPSSTNRSTVTTYFPSSVSTPLKIPRTVTSTTRMSTTFTSATSKLPSRITEKSTNNYTTSVGHLNPSKQTSKDIGIGVAIGILCGTILIAAIIGLVYRHKKRSQQSDIGVGIYSDPGKPATGSSKNVMTNPSYDNTIEGTSGQVSIIITASSRNISPSGTPKADRQATVQTSEPKAGHYSEPEFPLPRDTSPEDTNVYTYAEGYRGQRSPGSSGGEYADVNGSNFSQKTSLERRVDGEYSVLQNPSKDTSGSNDYDLLNHQRSTGVVIVASDDHEYGKLSSA